jgi:hypothetical protein
MKIKIITDVYKYFIGSMAHTSIAVDIVMKHYGTGPQYSPSGIRYYSRD